LLFYCCRLAIEATTERATLNAILSGYGTNI